MLTFKTTLLRVILPVFFSSAAAFAAPGGDVFIRDGDVAREARADYVELRDLAQRIFKICPPRECLYVGVGQSPTPLLALIEAVTGETTISLPLSDVRQLQSQTDSGVLTAIEQGMRRHLSRYLNPRETRKILVTDFVATTGASLTFAYSAIKEFLPNNEVHGFAMTAFGPRDRAEISIQRLESAGIRYRQLSRRLYTRIHERSYRSLGRVSKYDVMKLAALEYEPPATHESDRFHLLVNAFRQLSRNDLRLRKYHAVPVRLGVLNSCRYLLELPSAALSH